MNEAASSGGIAITGAAGYLGRHLLRRLREMGTPAVAVVRAPVELPDAAAVRVADVTDLDALCRAFADCETVVHLACLPVARCQADPAAGFRVNALGTAYVVTAAQRVGVRRIVYTSSAQVYGRPPARPIAEDAPCDPVTPYGAAKLCGEVVCRTAVHTHGLEVVILRLFNVYGLAADGTSRPTVETLFLQAVRAGRPPMVRGHPDHMRDFVHVRDVMGALERALSTPRADGRPINIGTGRGVSMIDLAWQVIRMLGSDLAPQVEPPTEPPITLCADITRARERLGWEPTIRLEEGLAELAEELEIMG